MSKTKERIRPRPLYVDENTLELARRIAKAERRSVGRQVAVILEQYAKDHEAVKPAPEAATNGN